MQSLATILLNLTKRLYPTGRAFRMAQGSTFEKVHKALITSEQEMLLAALGVLDEILPDNDNFTEQNASDWERRLAIRTGEGTPLEDRKDAIFRKYQYPGSVKTRSNWRFLEKELQQAGFDVYVHENRQETSTPGVYETIPIEAVLGNQLGGGMQMGQGLQMGPALLNLELVANFIDAEIDNQFVLPDTLRATFFIGGQTLGDPANVPAERRDEFRQIILFLKPLQTVGLLIINYT